MLRSRALYTFALLVWLLNFAQPVLAYAHMGAGGHLLVAVCSVEKRTQPGGKWVPGLPTAGTHADHDCCATAGAAALPMALPALAPVAAWSPPMHAVLHGRLAQAEATAYRSRAPPAQG